MRAPHAPLVAISASTVALGACALVGNIEAFDLTGAPAEAGADATSVDSLDADADDGTAEPNDAAIDAGDATNPGDADDDGNPNPSDAGHDADAADAGDARGPDGGPTYAATVLADHPVAYYRLDETSASMPAHDSSGNGHDGTYSPTGVTFAAKGLLAGDADTAVVTDGIVGQITIGPVFPFANLSPFTLEAWIQPATHQLAATPKIISHHESGTSGWLMGLVVAGGGQPNSYISRRYGAFGGSDLAIDSEMPAVVEQPAHVVTTFDGMYLIVYVDGKARAQVMSNMGVLDDQAPLVLATGSAAGFYAGVLDEVAIYDFALPPARITAHYDVGAGK
jgi:hypothetical protein